MLKYPNMNISNANAGSLLRFIAHIIFKEEVDAQRAHLCHKHQDGLYNCKICRGNSVRESYSYKCATCDMYFCVVHFCDHFLLFEYCKEHRLQINCISPYIEINENWVCSTPMSKIFQIVLNLGKCKIKLKITAGNLFGEDAIYCQFIRSTSLHNLGTI